jgi:hypothetical protein
MCALYFGDIRARGESDSECLRARGRAFKRVSEHVRESIWAI